MTLITFVLASPFVLRRTVFLTWFKDHLWVLVLCGVLFLAQYIFHVAMMMEQCCGGSSLMKQYLLMFRTVPWNYVYCFSYSAIMGVLVGCICLGYKAQSVCFVFVI